MDSKSLDAYRNRLLARQQEIVKSVLQVEESLHELEAEREIELMDRVQAEVWEQVLAELDDQERREAEEIEAALQRIEEGAYGRCEICGKSISPARLGALPMARRCVGCQKQTEMSS
jgi:DnaK suppressor protein